MSAAIGAGLRYGALGLPLAFVALPLYVVLPNHYAEQFGVPLAALGGVLLAVRSLDALLDPWIGLRVDRLLSGPFSRTLRWLALAAAVLMLGLTGLFFPLPALRGELPALLAWCAALLLATCLAWSVASVLHQAWGARLGGDDATQARRVAWREGAALVGVVLASVLPSLAGLPVSLTVFIVTLALGVLALARADRPVPEPDLPDTEEASPGPWQLPAFRRLLAVFMLNGIASAVPATLVLFFIRDRLQLPQWEGAFLASYFLAGALSLPLWVRSVDRLGLVRAWGVGMVLAVLTFCGAVLLGEGDGRGFLLVCVASGLALGADLALPGALLAAVVRRSGLGGRAEGRFFGWWTAASKLNLALAAGLALPLLQWAGYQPGSRDPQGLEMLGLTYALLPCVFKLMALALLWRLAGALPPTSLQGDPR